MKSQITSYKTKKIIKNILHFIFARITILKLRITKYSFFFAAYTPGLLAGGTLSCACAVSANEILSFAYCLQGGSNAKWNQNRWDVLYFNKLKFSKIIDFTTIPFFTPLFFIAHMLQDCKNKVTSNRTSFYPWPHGRVLRKRCLARQINQ